jgi:hypothetical protein
MDDRIHDEAFWWFAHEDYYYDEFRDQWAADRARKEAEWERDMSGWVEPREEEDDGY